MGGFIVFLALFFGAIGAIIGFSSAATFEEQLTLALASAGIAAAIGPVDRLLHVSASTSIVLGISGAHEGHEAG